METSSRETSQERGISFESLEKKVNAYLSDPQSEDPYLDVKDYFSGIKDPKKVVDGALTLLFSTKSRCLTPQSSDFDPKYGNVGTIAMHLPYFYPLHLTLFSRYVEASLKTAEGLSDQDKEKLVKKISEDVVIYCLIPDEVKRVIARLDNFLSPRENKAPIQSPQESSAHWYEKLNPFKKKIGLILQNENFFAPLRRKP